MKMNRTEYDFMDDLRKYKIFNETGARVMLIDILRRIGEKLAERGYEPAKHVIPIEFIRYVRARREMLRIGELTLFTVQPVDKIARRVLIGETEK